MYMESKYCVGTGRFLINVGGTASTAAVAVCKQTCNIIDGVHVVIRSINLNFSRQVFLNADDAAIVFRNVTCRFPAVSQVKHGFIVDFEILSTDQAPGGKLFKQIGGSLWYHSTLHCVRLTRSGGTVGKDCTVTTREYGLDNRLNEDLVHLVRRSAFVEDVEDVVKSESRASGDVPCRFFLQQCSRQGITTVVGQQRPCVGIFL